MASKPTAILSALIGSSSIEDPEHILKALNALPKSSRSHQEVLHTRIVALLKLDRYEDALRVFDEGGDLLAHRCAQEKAYALYKSGRFEEARHVIHRAGASGSRGLRHVAAQVAYRTEKFESAASIYKELGVDHASIEGEENDIRINSSAADAQLEWQGNGNLVDKSRKRHGREDLEAFETAYNAACGCIARGELGSGSILLKRSRDLCNALDELTDEDKKAELLPIMVQEAYLWTIMGKINEAEAVQGMIRVAEVPEPPTRVVAQNNEIAARPQENPFLTQLAFESMATLSKTEKLFDHQARIMQRNRYTINLQTLKYDGVIRSTANMLSQNPSPTSSPFVNSISAINAAASTRCQTDKESLKQMLLLLEKRPADVGLLLTIIQLYVLGNNSGPAITLLESFFKQLEQSTTPEHQDVRYAPGLVALLVSMYKLQGRKASVQEELGKAASYWRSKPAPSESLLRAAGISLLGSSKPKNLAAACEIFESLRKANPSDKLAVAGFVASNATTRFAAVQDDLEKLTPVKQLISGIDSAALEAGGIASLHVVMSEAGRKRPAPAKKVQPEKKKIRKSKMPKDFEEGKKMDLERWLPLKDRSSYRPKGKKGKKKALEATQGGVVKEEESLELVGGAGAVKVEKAPAGKAKKKKGKK